jgi:hypothetical protein
MTFYLECAHRNPMAEDGNQKMEGHMTFYLERKFKLSQQMQVAIILF